MSLKPNCRMLRMNDNSHEQFGEADARRDGRIRNDQPARELVAGGTRVGLRTDRAGTESAPVSPTEQRATRNREALSGEDHWLEPSPTDATDPALDGYAADRAKARATSELPAALQRCRHRVTSRGGCRPRGSLGAGGWTPMPASLGGVRRREVPTSGGHLGIAHLQPAAVDGLPEDSGAGRADPGEPGIDRRAAPSGAEREAGLSSRGHRAPGAARRPGRRVSSQRRRYGDAVGSGGLHGDHQRTASDSRVGGDAASISLSDRGFSLRQRVGVSQLPSGRSVEQTAGGGVHQIARLSDHRQCPGRRKERGRGAQADWVWPDWRRACGGDSEVLHGLLQPVSELPSSLRIRYHRDQLAGEAQANLPPQGLSNALREAHLPKRMDRIPERGNHRRDAETAGRSAERHRGRSADAESQGELVGSLPDHTMKPQRCGNAGTVERVESQKAGFPLFPRAPWESRQGQARFPHSHSAGDEGDGKVENQKQVSHFPTAPNPLSRNQKTKPCGGLRPPPEASPPFGRRLLAGKMNERRHRAAAVFQAHPALESTSRFRLIAHWNQFLISGSFVDWKML